MGKIFVTSDLHFWHTNILRFESRPFETVEAMNEALIQNWNAVVTAEDTVYILGDFCFASWPRTKEIVSRLNGHKIMIVGNHDDRWLKGVEDGYFDKITKYEELRYHDHVFVMFHHPIACWNGKEHGYIHLYGHIHSNFVDLPEGFDRTLSYNVGVDTNHYRPVDLDWIIEMKDKAKEPEKYVPKDTIYCYDNFDSSKRCPFWDYAENRGEQNYGICHYLNTTDYEQNQKINNSDAGCWSHSDKCTSELFWEQFPHSLLWDECKECGINEGKEIEE